MKKKVSLFLTALCCAVGAVSASEVDSVQEQAKQEAEQSDKQQSEVGMQTEEQPQEEDIAA